jgi:glycerol-3-phosphate dehydrogenase (NAD(P)+)
MHPRIRVLVLGHGEMGRAMERLLAERTALAVWDKFPQDGFRSVSLDEAAPRSEVVIFCVPTFPHAQVLAEVLPFLQPECICLSVAKGLDEAGRPVTRILEAALGENFGYGVLHGPMIAEEIQAGRHAFAQLGCRGAGVAGRVTTLFAGTRLQVTPVADMVGINWAVILKNVYAMAFGMADELGLGDNVRGWLAVTALRELDAIVQRMGGAPGTAYGLAGLGDLITTATSEHSHHHELGRRLARGGTRAGEAGGIEGEAIRTLGIVARGGLLDESAFPLFRWVHGVVRDPEDVRRRFEGFLDAMG